MQSREEAKQRAHEAGEAAKDRQAMMSAVVNIAKGYFDMKKEEYRMQRRNKRRRRNNGRRRNINLEDSCYSSSDSSVHSGNADVPMMDLRNRTAD